MVKPRDFSGALARPLANFARKPPIESPTRASASLMRVQIDMNGEFIEFVAGLKGQSNVFEIVQEFEVGNINILVLGKPPFHMPGPPGGPNRCNNRWNKPKD